MGWKEEGGDGEGEGEGGAEARNLRADLQEECSSNTH